MFRLGLQPLVLIYNLFVYLFNSKNSEAGYQALIFTFALTKGWSSKLISRLISLYNGKYDFSYPVEGIFGSYYKHDIDKIVKQIEKDGYYIFESRLSEKTCDELMQFALETNAYVRPHNTEDADCTTEGYQKRILTRIDRKKPIAIRYDFLPEQLLQNIEVQKLMSDMQLIAIAQEYLKCKPKSDVLGMWWHTSFDSKENAEAATMYHFDMDRIKWIKFFFYLTDTTKDNGAHQFIRNTHNGNIPFKFLKRGYARIPEKEVYEFYSEENYLVTYAAQRGTVIAEDTSGLHRGCPVRKDDRLVFQIQYSNSLFGANVHTFTLPSIVDKRLKKLLDDYPEIYSLYTKLTRKGACNEKNS